VADTGWEPAGQLYRRYVSAASRRTHADPDPDYLKTLPSCSTGVWDGHTHGRFIDSFTPGRRRPRPNRRWSANIPGQKLGFCASFRHHRLVAATTRPAICWLQRNDKSVVPALEHYSRRLSAAGFRAPVKRYGDPAGSFPRERWKRKLVPPCAGGQRSLLCAIRRPGAGAAAFPAPSGTMPIQAGGAENQAETSSSATYARQLAASLGESAARGGADPQVVAPAKEIRHSDQITSMPVSARSSRAGKPDCPDPQFSPTPTPMPHAVRCWQGRRQKREAAR